MQNILLNTDIQLKRWISLLGSHSSKQPCLAMVAEAAPDALSTPQLPAPALGMVGRAPALGEPAALTAS